jgi:hypothetical protein
MVQNAHCGVVRTSSIFEIHQKLALRSRRYRVPHAASSTALARALRRRARLYDVATLGSSLDLENSPLYRIFKEYTVLNAQKNLKFYRLTEFR